MHSDRHANDGAPGRSKTSDETLQEQVRQLQERLSDAEERRDALLSLLGHELRNPLAGIVNGIQVLSMISKADGETRQMCEIIERQASHIKRLVDDLVDVSRVSRGQIHLRKEQVDLGRLLRDLILENRPILSGMQCRLDYEPPEEPIYVDGDPTRLAQAFFHLLHNACKFTDATGNVKIDVRSDQQRSRAQVTFHDTGCGMTTELLCRAFEPFIKGDASQQRAFGGLGVGLALARGIIGSHEGTISAHSEGIGHGSQFVVELPMSVAPQMAETQSGSAGASGKRTPQRVLIIDDMRDSLAVLTRLFELDGHITQSASDAATGLRAAATFRPDIILCDISLPGELDGLGFARALRAHPQLQKIYAVSVTGYGQIEDRRRAKDAGFNYHLTKPVSAEDLSRLVSDLPHFE